MCYGTLLAHAVMATVRIIFVIGVGIFFGTGMGLSHNGFWPPAMFT